MVFGVLTLSVVVARGGLGVIWKVPDARAASGAYYGANDAWASTAAVDWPQANSNWCGIANVEMIVNYTYQAAANNQNAIRWGTGSNGQQQIFNDMNSTTGVSRWGTAAGGPNVAGPYLKADIAADGGTDPRSIAWGIFYESAYGGYLKAQQPGYLLPNGAMGYHNVIYHTDVQHAVGGLARTLERYRLPVSVTMAHGLHSDVITGVYSNNDPIQSFAADVNAVVVWDPGVGSPDGGYQQAREVVWSNYTFNNDWRMWGSTYQANPFNGVAYDPDPSVGIYTPNGTYTRHWIGYYVDIEPDSYAAISPDYAVDENGNIMLHP